jgi:hypothetical protein
VCSNLDHKNYLGWKLLSALITTVKKFYCIGPGEPRNKIKQKLLKGVYFYLLQKNSGEISKKRFFFLKGEG